MKLPRSPCRSCDRGRTCEASPDHCRRWAEWFLQTWEQVRQLYRKPLPPGPRYQEYYLAIAAKAAQREEQSPRR